MWVGYACYKNRKCKRTSVDKGHAIVMEDIAPDMSNCLLLLLVSRHALDSTDKQEELIKFAEATPGTHTEEASI
jgi:hypothetical protein